MNKTLERVLLGVRLIKRVNCAWCGIEGNDYDFVPVPPSGNRYFCCSDHLQGWLEENNYASHRN